MFTYWGGIHEGRRRDKEIDTQIWRSKRTFSGFSSLLWSQRKLSNTAKLSIYKSVFIQSSPMVRGLEKWLKEWHLTHNAQSAEKGERLARHQGRNEIRWHQGRNEIRWRQGQEASLAPPYSTLRSFASKCTVFKKVLVTSSGLFAPPQWFSAPIVIWRPENSAPFPLSLRPCKARAASYTHQKVVQRSTEDQVVW